MLRFIARVWAKLAYRFKLEAEAATNELNAGLSSRLAGEKRALVEQLNKEADDIEKRIMEVAAMEEKGFWLCECGKENTDAPAVQQAEGHAIHCECGKEMKLIKRDAMSGQDKYESDKERGEAEQIVANKRQTAKAESDNVSGSEKAAQYFRGQAANNRTVADKIKTF